MPRVTPYTILDIANLFQQVYGYRPYEVPGLPQSTTIDPGYQVPGYTAQTTTFLGGALYGSQDLLGREVFLPVTILGNGREYNLPYSVIGIRRRKEWHSTPMTELNTTAKQFISLNDFDLTLKGFLIGDYEQFPDQQLFDLNELFSIVNQTVTLKCALTDIFFTKGEKVMITDMEVPDKAKVQGVRDFQLRMLSDVDFNLYLT